MQSHHDEKVIGYHESVEAPRSYIAIMYIRASKYTIRKAGLA